MARLLRSATQPAVVIRDFAGVALLDSSPAPATLVDALSLEPTAAMRLARRIYWHLVEGGDYVVAAPDEQVAAAIETAWRALAEGRPTVHLPRRRRVRRELRRAIGGVRRDGRLVIVTKAGRSFFRLAEAEAALIGARTATDVEVLEHRDGHEFTPRRSVHSYGEHRDTPLETVAVPAGEVRRYTGDLTLHEGMVVSAETTLLPETFKWFEHQPLDNSQLRGITTRFARFRNEPLSADRLPGSYYLFEYKNSGHYGHLLTEGIAKLWGWEVARRHDPDVRLALRRHKRDRGRDVMRPDTAILQAYGVDPADIVWLEGPAQVERLYAATPQLHNKEPFSIDPRIVEVWDRMLHGLLREAPDPTTGTRIFVTRHSGHRLCHNWPDVEAEFTDAGFEVVEPARRSLAEQARLFADAEVVAGFGGTGLFNLIFAAHGPPVVVLNQAAYDARNEELITAARGSDLHYFWSAPDLPQPARGFDYAAFQSPWTFDLAQHRVPLRDLLASL